MTGLTMRISSSTAFGSSDMSACNAVRWSGNSVSSFRSEEHTSELQSHVNLVCRLLLEKKKQIHIRRYPSTNPPIKPHNTRQRHRRTTSPYSFVSTDIWQ